MIPVRSERIYSIQSALKCARRELKLYIFTEVYDVTLVCAGENTSPSVTSTPRSVQSLNVALTLALGHNNSMSQPG